MSVIEVEQMLTEIAPDAPAGADVEYDPEYFELEKLAQGTPESVIGEVTKPAEPPNWKEVKAAAIKLFERTRDLRVALILAAALLQEDGIEGFRDGVLVIRGFVDRLWDNFYPKLDPDDNNDPAIRVNLLKNLDGDGSAADIYKFKNRLREAVLTNSQQRIGRFSYRDIQVAKGEVTPPPPAEGEEATKPPEMSLIDAAFEDTTVEDLQGTQSLLQDIIDNINGIDSGVSGKVGGASGPELKGLTDVVEVLKGVIEEQLGRKGVGSGASEGGTGDADGGPTTTGSSGGGTLTGDCNSRQDVLKALDKICQYYERYESTSPVPIFIKRAKRLVTMNFLDVIKDLAPEAMEKINIFSGQSEDSSSSESVESSG